MQKGRCQWFYGTANCYLCALLVVEEEVPTSVCWSYGKGGTNLCMLIIEKGGAFLRMLIIKEGRYISQYTDHRRGEVHVSLY